MEPEVLDRISQFVAEEGLFSTGDKILVGFSGGPDSTCLLHALASLKFDCVAAYLHHGQRTEADHELHACEAFAQELGVPFVSARGDVPRMSSELGIGLEEAGRQARYGFFEEAARETGCDYIATAHTLDDHFETILLNLARGTGMAGLRGIPLKRDLIVRPILCLSKADTSAYCARKGLSVSYDPANHDLQFSRARVRHRIVPEMQILNPSASKAAFRMSKVVSEEDDFLNGMAAAALEQSERLDNPELAFLTRHLEVHLDRAKITSLPPVLFKRAMILASKVLGTSFDSKHVLSILHGVAETVKGSVTAPDGVVSLDWSPSSLTIRRREIVPPFRRELQYPGTVESLGLGWQLISSIETEAPESPTRKSLRARISIRAIRRPLVFRSYEPGEKMRPLGFEGHRKVSDLMAEAGVSELARSRLPVVSDIVGPLWIPGVCLDQRAVPSAMHPDEDRRALALEFKPLV